MFQALGNRHGQIVAADGKADRQEADEKEQAHGAFRGPAINHSHHRAEENHDHDGAKCPEIDVSGTHQREALPTAIGCIHRKQRCIIYVSGSVRLCPHKSWTEAADDIIKNCRPILKRQFHGHPRYQHGQIIARRHEFIAEH